MERSKVAVAALVTIAAFALITGTLLTQKDRLETSSAELNSFESEQEFISYIEDSQDTASQTRGTAGGSTEQLAENDAVAAHEGGTAAGEGYAVANRDVVEPERVKTDGENLFYSTRFPRHLHVIDNIPELDLKHNKSNISGRLVLNEENFLVVGREELKMLDKETLDEEWSREYDSRLETVRKTGDELIVVMRTDIDTDNPCPVRPMEDVAISCSSIYYPGHNSQADYTYNIVKLDFETGETLEEKAFTATSRTRVQVTPEKTYIAYTESTPETELMKEFLLEESSVSSDVKDRIREIDGYELTQRSERTEIGHAVESWIGSDENRRNQLESEVEQFEQENMDRFQETHLIEFSNEELEQEQQFSLTGAVRNVKSREDSLVISTRISGLNTYNLRSKLYTLDSEIDQVFDTENSIRNLELIEDAIIFESDDQLHRIDNAENRETMDAENLRFGSSAANYMLANEYDRKTEEGKIHLIDVSSLETVSTWEEDDPRLVYRFGDMKYQEGQNRLLLTGRNLTAIELGEGPSMQELKHDSGQIVSTGNYTLIVNRNKITSLYKDLETLSSIELARDRDRPRVMREPAIER